MQLSFRRPRRRRRRAGCVGQPKTLADLAQGQHGMLERLEVPDDVARRLMELGFVPGSRITAMFSAPGGDPCIYRVNGCEIALRLETARKLLLRTTSPKARQAL